MTFAEKLYTLRTQYGYSQETLAEKLNVSRQAISKWELGITLPETDIKRTIIIIEKVKQTPSKYPRKAGLPAKEPIM